MLRGLRVPAVRLRSGANLSVEPDDLSTEVWTQFQGHVINGVFPLGRYLGHSDHSGVFLTKSSELGPSEVAIKLVPADRALAELQLPRWKRAGNLAHPRLLRMLEWGGCQLDGLPYLYVVMEYADQTLAQLLLHRALTDDEAREMLLPILEALAFLHGRSLTQGNLKTTNIMVVGDQLKLASDTIRRVGEGGKLAPMRSHSLEEQERSGSTADDVRALGMSLFEALTRRPLSSLGETKEAVALPADFSPMFREVVTRCLSSKPNDRPGVTELLAWASRPTAGPVPETFQSVAPAVPDPKMPGPTPLSAAPSRAPLVATRLALPTARSLRLRVLLTAMFGAAVIVALIWTVARLAGAQRAPPPPLSIVQAAASPGQAPGSPSSATTRAGASAPTALAAKRARGDAAGPVAAIHEESPDVSPSARRSIRGHIKVSVRVTVDQAGSVSAAVADRAGPSKYFERIAIDAAKKWTFPPLDGPSQRVMQIRFDFSRDATTQRAVSLH
jgi:TonB family protein